jgi:selenocysteine-specific elongation factor
VLDAALATLVAAGRARVEGGRVGLVRAAQARARADAEAQLARRFGEQLRAGGLSPPDLAAATPGPEARSALERLVRQGVAVRTLDRVQKREVLFHADAVEAARRRLAPLLQPPGLLTGEAGRALGVSRKYTIPLLEHLDAVRFTRRIGDRRVLADQGGS